MLSEGGDSARPQSVPNKWMGRTLVRRAGLVLGGCGLLLGGGDRDRRLSWVGVTRLSPNLIQFIY